MTARPKSIDLVFTTNAGYSEVVEILQNEKTMRKYAKEIVSVFQIGVRTFNVTYENEETRLAIYKETDGKITLNDKLEKIYLPKKKVTGSI